MQRRKFDHKKAVNLYLVEHWTMQRIADKFNVSKTAVSAAFRRLNVSIYAGTHIQVKCTQCGKTKTVTRKKGKTQLRHYCSHECYLSHNASGEGYVQSRQGQRKARALVIRYFPLEEGMVVHHIDKNTLNNSLDNLMVFRSHAHHMSHHRGGRAVPLWEGLNVR